MVEAWCTSWLEHHIECLWTDNFGKEVPLSRRVFTGYCGRCCCGVGLEDTLPIYARLFSRSLTNVIKCTITFRHRRPEYPRWKVGTRRGCQQLNKWIFQSSNVYHRLHHKRTAHVLNLIMQDSDRILFWGKASWNVPDTFQSLFVVVLNSQLRILYLRNMMMLLLLLYPLTLLLLVHLHTIPIPRAPYSIITAICSLSGHVCDCWRL